MTIRQRLTLLEQSAQRGEYAIDGRLIRGPSHLARPFCRGMIQASDFAQAMASYGPGLLAMASLEIGVGQVQERVAQDRRDRDPRLILHDDAQLGDRCRRLALS